MRVQAFFLIAVSLFLSSQAFGSLEGDGNSIKRDAQTLGGQVQITQHPQYALHEISRSWVRVHEFEGSNGKVFAIAWRGKKHPDLQALLNSHLSDFQNALTQARKTHHHGGALSATIGNFHLEMGGHMGAIYGQVWLTDQIPTGMDLREIK